MSRRSLGSCHSVSFNPFGANVKTWETCTDNKPKFRTNKLDDCEEGLRISRGVREQQNFVLGVCVTDNDLWVCWKRAVWKRAKNTAGQARVVLCCCRAEADYPGRCRFHDQNVRSGRYCVILITRTCVRLRQPARKCCWFNRADKVFIPVAAVRIHPSHIVSPREHFNSKRP